MVAALTCYILGACLQGLRLSGRLSRYYPALLILAILAFSTHGYWLYGGIDLRGGQIPIFNLSSLAIWLLVLFAGLMSIKRPVENLFIFIFPLAALSIVLVWQFPEYHLLHIGGETRQLVHVLSAASAFAVMCAAALQAGLLAVQNDLLRHQRVGRLVNGLPPLEVMERLLFQMIWIGFFILTWMLVSSFYSFDHLFLPPLLQKILLTLASWVVFAALLCGRYFLGWRGRKVVYGTLTGFFLLIVIYFGSQLIPTLFIGLLS
jgi:ABC-type uncharacterized transport system permease subunit